MPRYRKKPVVIEAVRWTGENRDEIKNFAPEEYSVAGTLYFVGNQVAIVTLEGEMRAGPGDWIIRGVKDEVYPCKPDIFAATYEPAEDEAKP